MQPPSENSSTFQALEFLLYVVVAWLFGLIFQRASGGSFLGEHPWSGACIVILAAAVPMAWSASTGLARTIRIAVPLGIILLFASRGTGGGGAIARMQAGVDALHFLFLFAATFFSIQFSGSDSSPRRQARSQKSENTQPRPQQVPRPSENAFDRLVGQTTAVQSLQEIANVVRSGIRVGKRNAPHAVLLFLGPTGVGKTEAARALAQAVYGREDALIRFDMGQFTDSHQANRFYGPPPGYMGSDKGGQLTQAVFRKPRAVVLLDEVEKAHPQIWDAFLPVFDEGYIVDGSTNQKVDMTNTVIVLTSNLLAGTPGLAAFGPAELKDAVRDTGVFRPELVGRINEVLVFDALNNETIAQILRRRVDAALWSLSDQGISIFISEEQIEEMVQSVREAKFGVRQIDDVVRTFVRKAIAEQQGQGQPPAED